MALKKRGYRVISNDISIFSYHYANCYLRNNTIPDFDLGVLGIDGSNYEIKAQKSIKTKNNETGYSFFRGSEVI